MARKRVTVEQAIAAALSDSDKGKPCSAISLVFIKGMAQEEIHTKQLTGEPQSAEELGAFFVARATGYAQDLPGISNFSSFMAVMNRKRHSRLLSSKAS